MEGGLDCGGTAGNYVIVFPISSWQFPADALVFSQPMPHLPTRLLLPLVPTLILSGLLLDQTVSLWGQPVVVAATWLCFLYILHASDRPGRVMMLLCLAYASFGEVLLSLVWRVYDYRLGNLPLFVPPGHVLLFLLGVSIAPRVSLRAVHVITIAATLVVSALAVTQRDTFSVPLAMVFVASVTFGRERRLYATMFVIALAMELYGTWLGNWHWNPQVGRTGLVTLNPPVAAGAFYCALDLLVMLTTRLIPGRPAAIVPSTPSVQL